MRFFKQSFSALSVIVLLGSMLISAVVSLPNNFKATVKIVAGLGANNDYKYLSVAEPCNKNGVDRWTANDGSGRQIWHFDNVGGNVYTLHIEEGRNCDRKYLSTSGDPHNTGVDLWTGDDGSGR